MIVNEAPRIDTLLENGKQCILPGSPITLTLKNSQSIARYQIEYQADGGQWEEVAILSKSGTDGQPVQFMILDGLTLEGRLRIKAAIPTRDGNGFCEKIMYGEAEVRPGISLFEVEGSALYCVNDQPEVSIRLTGSSPGIIYRLVPSPMPAQDVTLTGDGNPLEFKGHYPAGYYHIVGESQYCRDTMNGEAMITASPLPALYDLIVKQHICPGETTGILQLSGSETGIKYDLNIRKGESWEIVHTYTGNGQPISMPGLLAGDYRIHARNTLINCDQEFPMTVSLEEKASPSLCNLKFAGNDSVYCLNSISNIALSYPCYETGSSYQLKRNGIAEGNVITGNNLNWSNLKEGDYTLEVINEWGCPATTAIRRITGQAAPETFTLTGTQIYCTPGQTGCYLELNDSKAGIEYSFRRLSGSVLKDTISRGGTIRINVWPPEEEEFIVVATDTTPEQCQTTMQGSVRMEQSRIKVVPESPVIVNYNESIPLTLAISDYTGELRIRWDNTRHLIATGENTLTPQTVTLTESYYFPVTVSDDNCDIQSGVQVNCIGGDLKIRILQSDGMTAIGDTLRICDEDLLTLCGMASGGATGNYQYRWTDGGREIGQSNPLTGYLKTTDGYIYAEVKDNHETAKDSVWIVVNETSRIRVIPGQGVIPEWYLGETPLKIKGNELILRSVETKDEGTYQVKVANACGEIIRPVGTLYVDDYMHVTDASNPTMIRCLGSSEHLFVNISPSKRVKYTWEYTDGTRVNGSSELTVGPFQEVTTQIYWVRFMNKCGMAPGEYNYREFVVHVPKPFVLPTDLPREIITCANGQDTVIRLNMDPSTYANYKWWYRKNRSDVKRELLPSTTDTLEISCSTDKPGYYYCDLSNACDAKTTETIWVRIDSIPVILGSLANDTICEGGQLVLNLPATGGGLHYDWYILKAGSSIPEIITDIQEEYESVGELRLTATAAHDNCEIWCHIHNNCGEKFSNRIRLSVDKRRQVEITPADTTICAGSYAEIRITLHNGTAPWCYRYTQEENPDIQETRIAERLTDVLDISQRGNYTETFVSDGGKCNYADGNSTFRSNNYYVPEARISLTGQDSLCRGEKTQLSVSVSYPPLPAGVTPSDGPWEIVIPSVFASRYVWILC